MRTVKLIVLLAISTLVFSWFSSLVTAYYPTYTVRLLVAYDEEWVSTAFWVYGYSGKVLAQIILQSAFYHFEEVFDITYIIKGFVTWDSCDSINEMRVMRIEAITETGFVSGEDADILVAFTDQECPDAYGSADEYLGAVIVTESYLSGVGQATDNILQHELSHLYGGIDERVEDLMCVMNIYPYQVGFRYYVRTALVTNEWCSDCVDVISSNRAIWGYASSGEGGGGATDPQFTPDSTEGVEQ